MDQVRIGIVGMGIGRHNGRALSENPRGTVVALCDLVEERMDEFAEELPGSVTKYTDYKEMCQDPNVDAVFVGTPNQWHVPIALEAVRQDKHVMVTKPLADSEEAARRLVEAAERAEVVNMMSLSTRFADEVRYLGQLGQAGDLGEIYYARARSVRRSGIPAWNLGFITEGGGAFRDMGVHVLDSAWWLLGMPRPVSVTGVAGAKFGPRGQGYWKYSVPSDEIYRQFAADDYAGGFIRFENGAGLQVESFWASHQPNELQIELFGTEAGAKLRPVTLYRTVNGAPQDIAVELPAGPTAWDNIADHFIACILDGIPCQAPLRHGLIVQEMMEALLQSAKLGKEIYFDGDKAQ
jgi:predicted dehydrogenase